MKNKLGKRLNFGKERYDEKSITQKAAKRICG